MKAIDYVTIAATLGSILYMTAYARGYNKGTRDTEELTIDYYEAYRDVEGRISPVIADRDNEAYHALVRCSKPIDNKFYFIGNEEGEGLIKRCREVRE